MIYITTTWNNQSLKYFNQLLVIIMIEILLYKGYKELGIPQLEPYQLEKIEIKESGSGTVTMEQKFTNISIYGLTDAIVSNVV